MSEQPVQQRLASADVYRGFVMFLMMAEVLNFEKVSEALPESGFWQFLSFHQSHVAWTGCSLHDLIQPSFSFLVGVVLPFSIANRMTKGASFGALFRHALWRSLLLILLGVFLRSQGAKQTYFTFEDTLSQIGLGYPILFLLGFRGLKTHIIALVVILIGYWLAFVFYPLPTEGFNYTAAGVTADWSHNVTGLAAHWNKNTNTAWAFDTWFLNLFPRENHFQNNGGGYATLSFIPTLGTMILGLIAGNIFKNNPLNKIKTFIYLGIGGLALGLIIHFTDICPNVKRIWTPTWVLFSGGWCFLFLAFFHWLIDIKKEVKITFPLLVIGINSIAAYVIAHTIDAYISKSLYIHLGQNYHHIFGASYQTLVHGGLILFFEWWILYWLYKKRIFIKI
jgi:predicted acyltransferase